MAITLGTGAERAPAADLVKDSDTKRFMQDVIEASRKVPVIVDFWAPWCGPCKQLGPMLEKVVKQAGGKVRLVKVNVDENQQLAAQMRVQSIPAVFAFVNGQPVDGFMGALPESQIKQFVQRLASAGGPTEEDNVIEEALGQAKDLLDAGNHAAAGNLYAQILQHDPENPQAIAGHLRCLIKAGNSDEAQIGRAHV